MIKWERHRNEHPRFKTYFVGSPHPLYVYYIIPVGKKWHVELLNLHLLTRLGICKTIKEAKQCCELDYRNNKDDKEVK